MTSYSKNQARILVRGRLAAVTEQEHKAASIVVNKKAETLLAELIATHGVKSALLYQPLDIYHEIDLSPLRAAFPALQFDYVSQTKNAAFPDVPYDCIFVPLLGFNDDNYRLGHGGGWYDRLLQQQSGAIKVGVGLEVSRINFDVDTYDVPMDDILIETRPI